MPRLGGVGYFCIWLPEQKILRRFSTRIRYHALVDHSGRSKPSGIRCAKTGPVIQPMRNRLREQNEARGGSSGVS